MESYSFIALPIAIVIGLGMVILTKRNKKLKLNSLDKVGIFTNIILIPIYFLMSSFAAVLAMAEIPIPEGLSLPYIVGEILLFFIACTPIVCGFSLGLAVRFRRFGRSKQSFLIQFFGATWFAVANLIYEIAYASGLFVVNW